MIPENWAEKPSLSPPPHLGWGKICWLQIYPLQAISSNFGFCGRKAHPPQRMREFFLTSDLSVSGNFKQIWILLQKSPPPPTGWGKTFWLQIYPFQVISSNFGFCGRKPTPQDERKLFDFRSIHFRQFQATLVFLWQKSPHSPSMREIFFDFRSIHFRQFWATLVYVAEKPPIPRMRENFLTSDLWFLWLTSHK